ncbi:ATP-binding protein [Ilumatobacter sp.]|uniref:DNA polymerase III subunit n=1 Tax=Ilumatobacter sp. TaxID=1967498 RepID=UPI003B5176D7
MSSVWDDVVGQKPAVERLEAAAVGGPVHAYLFVGPPGCTKVEAARAFAARVLGGGDDPDQRDARLALRGEHPDVREVRRVGPSISAEQAREIVRVSSLAPTEGPRKVLVLDEFHLLRPEGAALLLKTIEEPPESTMFVICADFVPHELVTISSRCARIDFRPIAEGVVAARLLTEGVGPLEAQAAARAAMGDLDRARLLASDPELAERRRGFVEAARRLDGSGAVAMAVAAELLESIDRAAEPLSARHASEVAELDARIAELGERGSGKKQLEDRHRRELRRHRTDELRAGLATMSATYRDSMTSGAAVDVDGCARAVHRIHGALESLERNPNERLLMESLMWSLPDTTGVTA